MRWAMIKCPLVTYATLLSTTNQYEKPQWEITVHRVSKKFQSILYTRCDYLPVLGLNLNHVDKMDRCNSWSSSKLSLPIRERVLLTLNLLNFWKITWIYKDFSARSRHLRQGYLIAPHSILRDAIAYTCLRYLLMAPKSSYICIL